MVAACWSPAMPRIGIAAPNSSGIGHAEIGGAIAHLRQHGARARRTARSSSSSQSPAADVEQQRARGVGGVGGVHRARRSAARAGSCRSCRRRVRRARPPRARRRHCRAARRSWCRRNRDRAAGRSCAVTSGSCPSAFSARAEVGRAPVLPDDGVVDRLAGRAVPHHAVSRWLVMPMAAIVARRDAGLARAPSRAVATTRSPDLLRRRAPPSRLREVLGELLLRAAGDRGSGRRTGSRASRSCPGRWPEWFRSCASSPRSVSLACRR